MFLKHTVVFLAIYDRKFIIVIIALECQERRQKWIEFSIWQIFDRTQVDRQQQLEFAKKLYSL